MIIFNTHDLYGKVILELTSRHLNNTRDNEKQNRNLCSDNSFVVC